jgi:hypothetical protein
MSRYNYFSRPIPIMSFRQRKKPLFIIFSCLGFLLLLSTYLIDSFENEDELITKEISLQIKPEILADEAGASEEQAVVSDGGAQSQAANSDGMDNNSQTGDQMQNNDNSQTNNQMALQSQQAIVVSSESPNSTSVSVVQQADAPANTQSTTTQPTTVTPQQ